MWRARCRWLAAAAVLAAGCGPYADYVPVFPPPRPLQARTAAQVDIFLVTPPARPHADIGMLWVATKDGTLEQMLTLLRVTAGQHGCDAVVVTRVASRSAGLSTAVDLEASCEVYTSPPISAASAHP